MKIRPPDGSNIPEQPDEISGEKKADANFDIQSPEEGAQGVEAGQTGKVIYADFLQGAEGAAEVGRRFIDNVTQEFEGSIGAQDLNQISSMLQELTEEDPYIQNKLDRISSLLVKAK